LDNDILLKDTEKQERSSLSTQQVHSSCWSSLLNWVLWLGIAFFMLMGWVRLIYAITNWYWLNFSGIRPGPLYLAVSGGLWGLVGTFTLVWIILRRPWYRLVGLFAALFFAITYWINRLFIATGPVGGNNTLFAALFTLLLLSYVILVLRPTGELRALTQK
jgi:hypothetical protein